MQSTMVLRFSFSTELEVDQWIADYIVGRPRDAVTLEQMKEGLQHLDRGSKLREYFLREARRACNQHPDNG